MMPPALLETRFRATTRISVSAGEEPATRALETRMRSSASGADAAGAASGLSSIKGGKPVRRA